jgi:hypothetical protein
MVLPSADMARLTHFIKARTNFGYERPCLSADGNNIISFLALQGLLDNFCLRHPTPGSSDLLESKVSDVSRRGKNN